MKQGNSKRNYLYQKQSSNAKIFKSSAKWSDSRNKPSANGLYHNDHKCQVFWILSILAARCGFTREQQWSECKLCEKILLSFSPQHYQLTHMLFHTYKLEGAFVTKCLRAWKGQKVLEVNFIVYRRNVWPLWFLVDLLFTGQDLALKLFLLQKVELSGKK